MTRARTRAAVRRAPLARAAVRRAPLARAAVRRAPLARAAVRRAPLARAAVRRAPLARAAVRRAPLARAALALVAAALLVPATAAAYVAPGATIVSASLERLEQADDATLAVAVSGDGRYVAFQTRARNFFADDDPDPPDRYRHGGIFRRDLQTGALELVAHGDVREEVGDALVARGAANPSLSADGRFVAFSTAEPLGPADANGAIDVYVRDMTRAPAAPGAYEPISARDGGDVPAAYPVAEPGRDPGAEVTAAAAISADGQRVVFRTAAPSDLAGPGTPALQLFLRDRAARTTRLLTRDRASGEPAGGADAAAVISADGASVVWVGRNAYRIAERLPDEPFDDQVRSYLWLRVADGPGAQVRRVTGAVDLDDPGCNHAAPFAPSPTALGPCYGPLTVPEDGPAGLAFTVPAISGDGWLVAFLTSASVRPLLTGVANDLFLADMRPGSSRKAATIELTREGTGPAAGGSIAALSMSADGQWLALSAQRTQFTLPALRLLGTARPVPDRSELYLVDVAARTLERAVRSAGGGDVDGNLVAPSLSTDGRRLAFVSGATGLFFGDANERPDAFVVTREDAAPPELPPPPLPPAPAAVQDAEPVQPRRARRRLWVTIQRAPGGRIRLLVRARSAGRLRVVVRARVPGQGRRARVVASASRRVARAGRVVITLRLKRRYRAALRREGRLEAQATVTLRPASGPMYERRLAVVFKQSG